MNGFCYEMKQQTDLSKSQVILKRHLLVYYLKNTLVYTTMYLVLFMLIRTLAIMKYVNDNISLSENFRFIFPILNWKRIKKFFLDRYL